MWKESEEKGSLNQYNSGIKYKRKRNLEGGKRKEQKK